MKKKKIYEGKILGLSVYDGTIEGRKVKREMIEHRFPHGYILEIPAGTLEKKEDPIHCALRELEEETGYRAKKMIPLISFYPSIGYNSEIIHCYIASGLKKIADLKLDADEILSVEKIGLDKLIRMIKTGKIQDSKTICAVMTYAVKKKLN